MDNKKLIKKGSNMKLNVSEIKYIRQSLEHRLVYYESKSGYEQFANELKPIIKKYK